MGGGNGREQKRAANYSRIQRATRVADSRRVVALIARLPVASLVLVAWARSWRWLRPANGDLVSARSEQTIASIAKSGQNVSVRIELAIECCRDDTHVRIMARERTQSLGCSNEAQKTNARCTRALQ